MSEFEIQQTLISGYELLRAAGGSDTAIDLTDAGDYANKPSGAYDLTKNPQQGSVANAAEIIIGGSDAADEAFTWRLLGWKDVNGPAKLLADGTGILGTQAMVKFLHGNQAVATNYFWADTIVVSNDYGAKEIKASKIGGNSVCTLTFDAIGYRYILLEITVGTAATAIAYISWF